MADITRLSDEELFKLAGISPDRNSSDLASFVEQQESGGRRYGSDGKILEGPVTRDGTTAKGEMQVMGSTASNPGFGVIPARDNSPEERARVGRDYLAAMQNRYGDTPTALAAYNAGPGNVDKYGGIPPFRETQDYVKNITTNMQGGAGNDPLAPDLTKLSDDELFRIAGVAKPLPKTIEEIPEKPKAVATVDPVRKVVRYDRGGLPYESEDTPSRPFLRTAKNVAAGTVGTAMGLGQLATSALPGVSMVPELAEMAGQPNLAKGARTLLEGDLTDKFIRKPFDEMTGGLTKPRDSTERIQDTALEFAASALLPLGLAGKSAAMAKMVPKTITDFASLGLGALGAGVGREGWGDTGEMVAALTGASSPAGIKGIVKALLPSGKGVNTAAIKAASELNIPLPPSAKTNSRIIKFLESRSAQSGLSGDSFDNLAKEIDDSTISTFDEVLDSISPTRNLTPEQVGQTAQRSLGSRQKAGQRLMRSQYEPMLETYGAKQAEAKNTLAYIDKVLPKLEKTLASSPSKDKVLQVFKDISGKLRRADVPEDLWGTTDIETLVNSKIDLSDIADFETVGGVKKYLTGLVGAVRKDIDATGKAIPEFGQAYTQANSTARATISNLRSDLVKAIVGEEKPERVLAKLTQPSDITKLEQAAGNSAKMKRVVGQLKRAKLEELLMDGLVTEVENSDRKAVQFGRVASRISGDNKNYEMIQRLAGQQNMQKMEKLQTIAKSITSGRQFYNMSKSGNVAQDFSLLSASVAGVLTGNPVLMAAPFTPYITAKILTSVPIMNNLLKGGQALARGETIGQTALKNIGLALTKELSAIGIDNDAP